MLFLLQSIVIIVAIIVVIAMIGALRREGNPFEQLIKTPHKWRLMIAGFVANVADTLGIGNFAVFVAFNKSWHFVDDKKLPGTLNSASALPAMVQSLFFLKFIDIDITTLVTLVGATCIGGLFSSLIVSRLNRQTIRLVMALGFTGITLLVLGNQFHLFPIGGSDTALHSHKLAIGFGAMLLTGMLPAIGVGIYAPTQVILFFLGLSPFIAFPIMTTAGVIAQSLTALTFISKKNAAIAESLILIIPGIIGVLIAAPFVTYVNPSILRWMLCAIVAYNATTTWKTYKKERLQLAVI